MVTGFQKYLIDKGFKRTVTEYRAGKWHEIENHTDVFISTYGPSAYHFKKDGYWFWWGLSEMGRPPVMFLGMARMFIIQNEKSFRTDEDGYRVLFSQWGTDRYDEIFDVAASDDKYFKIDCRNEKNISIEIAKRTIGRLW